MKNLEILAFLGRISFDFKEGVHKSFLPLPELKWPRGMGGIVKKKIFLDFQTLNQHKKLLFMCRKALEETCRSHKQKNKNFTFQHCIISTPPLVFNILSIQGGGTYYARYGIYIYKVASS